MNKTNTLIEALLSQGGFIQVNKYLAKQLGEKEAFVIGFLIDRQKYHRQTNTLTNINGVERFYSTSSAYPYSSPDAYKRTLTSLRSKGLIDWIVKGVPAKAYFSINLELVQTMIENGYSSEMSQLCENAQLDSIDSHNQLCENAQLEMRKRITINKNRLNKNILNKGVMSESKDSTTTKPKKKTISERKEIFKQSIFSESNKSKYGDKMLIRFFNYWSEHKPKGRKMLWEFRKTFNLTGRLATWSAQDEERTLGKSNSEILTPYESFVKQHPNCFTKQYGNYEPIDQGFGFKILEGKQVPILRPSIGLASSADVSAKNSPSIPENKESRLEAVIQANPKKAAALIAGIGIHSLTDTA